MEEYLLKREVQIAPFSWIKSRLFWAFLWLPPRKPDSESMSGALSDARSAKAGVDIYIDVDSLIRI